MLATFDLHEYMFLIVKDKVLEFFSFCILVIL